MRVRRDVKKSVFECMGCTQAPGERGMCCEGEEFGNGNDV